VSNLDYTVDYILLDKDYEPLTRANPKSKSSDELILELATIDSKSSNKLTLELATIDLREATNKLINLAKTISKALDIDSYKTDNNVALITKR
jgi:hypothetical protein